VGDGGTFQDWFNSVQLITKIFLVSTLLSGTLLTFGWVSDYDMILDWAKIRYKFQIWRLFTACVYAGKFSFNFAMHTYILYQNCQRYEANPFNTGAGGNTADFLWMVLLSMATLLVIAFYFDMMVISEPMMYVILYVWSRREPDTISNIFGFKFKSLYLPWAYIAMRLVMGGSITEPLVGIAVGHLFYFFAEVFPVSHGRRLIVTPRFCTEVATYLTGFTLPGGSVQGVPSGAQPAGPTVGSAEAQRGNDNPGLRQRGGAAAGGYNWGRGRPLGT
jgi:Derlin-2/3